MGGVAARMAGARLAGGRGGDLSSAAALTQALGGLKGPMMKVAQMMATVPDLLPPEYADELQKLQSDAPPMGAAFVKRRMGAELGPDWQARFATFDYAPAAAASLGQVHRATSKEGRALALQAAISRHALGGRGGSRPTRHVVRRASAHAGRRRYARDGEGDRGARPAKSLIIAERHATSRLYRGILADEPAVRVPDVMPDLSTGRLLTMSWLTGERMLDFKGADAETRNRLATAMFKAWWMPFNRFGVIHGDPHLGNYTVFRDDGVPTGINLLDYGCIRIFPSRFVAGVVDLYEGLRGNDRARVVHAYESWGFRALNAEMIDTLNIWARFIYGPLLEDRERTIADGVAPGQYGRREAFELHQALKRQGPVRIPREFVFMDRAAVGLGSVFLHLDAKLNFHRLFSDALGAFSQTELETRQRAALDAAGLPAPDPSDRT